MGIIEKEERRKQRQIAEEERQIAAEEKRQIAELDNAVDFIYNGQIVNTIEQLASLIKKLEENKENDKQVKEIEEKIQALMETLKGLLGKLGSISSSFTSGLLDGTIRILNSTGGLLKVLGKGLVTILGIIGSKTLHALKAEMERIKAEYASEQARLKRQQEAARREEEAAAAAERRASASARRDGTVTSMFGRIPNLFGPSTQTQTQTQTRSNRSSPSPRENKPVKRRQHKSLWQTTVEEGAVYLNNPKGALNTAERERRERGEYNTNRKDPGSENARRSLRQVNKPGQTFRQEKMG